MLLNICQVEEVKSVNLNVECFLEVQANVVINVDDKNTSGKYKFPSKEEEKIIMYFTNEKIFFSINSEYNIRNPLNIPGNIEIDRLTLSIEKYYKGNKGTEIQLGGTVLLGQIALCGYIYFDNLTTKVLEIVLAKPISVDEIFSAFLPDCIWPKDFIDITFNTGKLYYAKEAIKLADYNREIFKFEKGLHLSTQIDVLGFTFDVLSDIDDSGISVIGTKKTGIDLEIVQFSNPSISIGVHKDSLKHTTNKNFGFAAEVSIFNEKCLNIKNVSYDTSINGIRGDFALDFDIDSDSLKSLGLNNVNLKGDIEFIWSKSRGLHIIKWPISMDTDMIEYTKLIDKVSDFLNRDCGKIVDFIFKEIITTKLNMNLGMGKSENKEQFNIEFTPEYCIFIRNEEILSVSLDKMNVTIPKPKSIKSFLESLAGILIDNAEKVVEQIFSDNEKLAKFIAAVGITKLSEAIISSLICRAMKNTKVNDLMDKVKKLAEKAAEEVVLDGALAAATEGIADAESALAMFSGAIAFFATMLDQMKESSASDKYKEVEVRKEKAEKDKIEAENSKQNVINAIKKWLIIENLVMKKEKEKILVQWQSNEQAKQYNLTFNVLVYVNDRNNIIFNKEISDNIISIPYSEQEGYEIIFVEVKEVLLYNKTDTDGQIKKYTYEGDIFTTSMEIGTISIPVLRKVEYADETLQIMWDSLPGVKLYELQITDDSGIQVGNITHVSLANEYVLDCEEFDLVSNSSYFVKIRAVQGEKRGQWSEGKRVSIPGIQTRAINIAKKLKEKGKAEKETAERIMKIFPDITATEMAKALAAAFGTEIKTPEEFTQDLKDKGVEVQEASYKLKKRYPELTAEKITNICIIVYGNVEIETMAKALKLADFTVQEVASALKVNYHGITATELALTLKKVFG